MSIAIDLTIVAIVGFGVWRGYKNGIIRGVCGVLALIVSIFTANVIATAYSGEFTGMLKPFVSGVVDTVITDVLETGTDIYDTLPSAEEPGAADAYDMAFLVLRNVGLMPGAAKQVAEMAVSDGTSGMTSGGISADITDKLTSMLAYAAVFGVCFILLAIAFAVIGNLIDFVFSIPGFEMLDSIIGAAFGLIKGLIIIFVIAAVIRYIGLAAASIVEQTTVLKYIVNTNPIASILGI